MRRILAVISIVLAIGAFVLLCLVLPFGINILIPIFMFAFAFMLFLVVKRMDSDETGADKAKPNELAFYDSAETEKPPMNSENAGHNSKNAGHKKDKTKTGKSDRKKRK